MNLVHITHGQYRLVNEKLSTSVHDLFVPEPRYNFAPLALPLRQFSHRWFR